MARRTHTHVPKRRHTVLVLQGGGALGAYQAGVYEELHTRGLAPDCHQVEFFFQCDLVSNTASAGTEPDSSQVGVEWRSAVELRQLCFFPQALLDAIETGRGPASYGGRTHRER